MRWFGSWLCKTMRSFNYLLYRTIIQNFFVPKRTMSVMLQPCVTIRQKKKLNENVGALPSDRIKFGFCVRWFWWEQERARVRFAWFVILVVPNERRDLFAWLAALFRTTWALYQCINVHIPSSTLRPPNIDLLVPVVLSVDCIAQSYIYMIKKVDNSINHNKISNHASWQSNGWNI